MVTGLIATLIVVPLTCVLVFVPLWLVQEFNLGIWVLIVSASLYLLIMLGGGWGALGWTLLRRKRWLDSVFAPLGLEGRGYMFSGRQYQGTVQGREVMARFYRGPTLDLYVSTPLQTRVGIGDRSRVGLAVAGVFNREPLTLADPDLEALSVFPLDEDWTRSLLAHPEAKRLLLRLMMAGDSWALMRQVYLQPGTFYLRLYRNKNLFRYSVTPEEARQWLDDLIALARIAEDLPAPRVTAEETPVERLVRSGRIVSIVWIVLAVVLGIPLCLLTIGGAIFFLFSIR
jgi:hypothetical protein